MAHEQYFEEALTHTGLYESDGNDQWKSAAERDMDANINPSGGFDCNICLELVQDPVVTLCGHLYCWPCIYKWLHFRVTSTEDERLRPQQCPVCKADVSLNTLVPLYGRGIATKPSEGKTPHLGSMIPKRPTALGCGAETSRSQSTTISPRFGHEYHSYEPPMHFVHPDSYQSSTVSRHDGRRMNLYDPTTSGVLGESVYARFFGNSITNFHNYPSSTYFVGSTTPRIRRRMIQVDRSLGRVCFFLFCCAFLCLALF